MSFLEEPEYKPMCCGVESKWVCHTPTLYYFYCTRCKDEVDPVRGGKDVYCAPVLPEGNEESLSEYLGTWGGDYPIPKSFPSSSRLERKFLYFKTEHDAVVCQAETGRANKGKVSAFFVCLLHQAPDCQELENVWELSYTLDTT